MTPLRRRSGLLVTNSVLLLCLWVFAGTAAWCTTALAAEPPATQPSTDPPTCGVEVVDPVVFLADRRAALEKRLDELTVQLGPRHPEVVRTQTALAQVRKRLDEARVFFDVTADSADRAGEIYIGGHAKRVGVYHKPAGPLSLKRALAMCGGVDDQAGEWVAITRLHVGSEFTWSIKLADLEAGTSTDILLCPEDRVFVCGKSVKTRPTTKP